MCVIPALVKTNDTLDLDFLFIHVELRMLVTVARALPRAQSKERAIVGGNDRRGVLTDVWAAEPVPPGHRSHDIGDVPRRD